MSGTRYGWKTPMTALCAPAVLIIGPRILKQVCTPSFFRTGATKRMAGWLTGANMNATLHSSTHFTICPGVRSILTPKASRTSALPHDEERDRLPALATVQPQAALHTTEAVEILIVSAPSPPVPTMSRSFLSPQTYWFACLVHGFEHTGNLRRSLFSCSEERQQTPDLNFIGTFQDFTKGGFRCVFYFLICVFYFFT